MSELAARLRRETAALHREAERSDLIVALLEGRLARPVYVRLLRNLHALYEALEHAVGALSPPAPVAGLIPPALARTRAIAADLDVLHGPGWQAELPLATATLAHVERIRRIAGSDPVLLAAPAYVRYLGDLNGGRVLERSVRRALGLATGGAGVRFYDFGGPAAAAALAAAFRRGLDALSDRVPAAGRTGAPSLTDRLVAEARWWFRAHLQLFEELVVSASR